MAQTSFALMTTLGRAKEAAALANATTIEITHIAIGDGVTVPSGGETELYNEVARKTISGSGTVVGASNVAYFDCFLAAEDGPYTIREAGLIDSEGDLIAIARYDPPIHKPIPASGQTVEGTIRLEVAFSNVANVTVVVDPSLQVPLQRLTVLPWVPVGSMTLSSPPADPEPGDTYLIGAGATGAWTGQSGKLAEYTVAGWAIIDPPDGHGIGLPDGSAFTRRDGVYRPLGWIVSNLTIAIGPGPGSDFGTIPEAMDWLRTRLIADGAIVTLALQSGQHIYDGVDVVLNHPHGQRIRLIGAAMLAADPVFADFTVTGYGSAARAADGTANLAMLRTKFASELRLLNGARLLIKGGGVGLLDDILVTGNGFNQYGVVIEGARAIIDTFAVHGFGNDNFVLTDSAELGMAGGVICSTASAADGFEASMSKVFRYPGGDNLSGAGNLYARFICCGNGNAGLEALRGTDVVVSNIYALGNGSSGVRIQLHSSLVVTASPDSVFNASQNANMGLEVDGSNADVVAKTQTMANNGVVGVYAINQSMVYLSAAPANVALTGNGNHGAAVRTGSSLHAIAPLANSNLIDGLNAIDAAFMRVEGGQVNNNTRYGARADTGSHVRLIGAAVTGNGLADMAPAPGTVGNNNAYLQNS